MFNVGDRVRVYKTNWGPKKPFIAVIGYLGETLED